MTGKMTEDKLDVYAEMFVKAFSQPPWSESWSHEQALRRIREVMNTPNFYGMEYWQNDVLAGFIMGNCSQSFDGVHCEIKEFCVDAAFQGKGIGDSLLQRFLKFIEEKGIKSTFLLTAKGDRTEGFYRKRGFRTSDTMIMMGR